MTAAQLKASILDLAIRGKLVAQDPGDEPAEKLLERIWNGRVEGEMCKKSGRGTRPACPQSIADEEKPFELPKGWAWCRLGEIGRWGSGATPAKGVSAYYKDGTIPWLLTGDLNDSIVEDVPNKITEKALNETSVKVNPPGAVLIAMYGATIGKVAILGVSATTNQACCACVPHGCVCNWYLFYFLMSQREAFRKRGEGGAQPNISKEKIVTTMIPLPPLAEQKRIVAKIEELMPLVKRYEAAEQKRVKLDGEIAAKMKASLLDQAIRGKLVPQDPGDEPAEKLLERIWGGKNSRGERVERGEVSNEEKPFELPKGWAWCRLGEICQLLSGRDLDPSQYSSTGGGVPYLTGASNITSGKVVINRWTDSPIVMAQRGDLLVTCKGTVGAMAILNEERVHIARQIMAVRVFPCVTTQYIRLVIATNVVRLQRNAKSMIPGIARDDMLNLPIPLPPLAEQKRIVAKIEELMPLVDRVARVKGG